MAPSASGKTQEQSHCGRHTAHEETKKQGHFIRGFAALVREEGRRELARIAKRSQMIEENQRLAKIDRLGNDGIRGLEARC